MSVGYNGAPNGYNDEHMPWDREGDFVNTKYAYVCHAELNAILNNKGSVYINTPWKNHGGRILERSDYRYVPLSILKALKVVESSSKSHAFDIINLTNSMLFISGNFSL